MNKAYAPPGESVEKDKVQPTDSGVSFLPAPSAQDIAPALGLF